MNATGTQKRDPTGIGKQGKVWQVSVRWRSKLGKTLQLALRWERTWLGSLGEDCRLGDEVHEISSTQIKEDLLYIAKEFRLLCQCFPKCFYENTGYVKC